MDESATDALKRMYERLTFKPAQPGQWEEVLEMNTPENQDALKDALVRYKADPDEEC